MTTGRGFHLQGGGDIELKKKKVQPKDNTILPRNSYQPRHPNNG